MIFKPSYELPQLLLSHFSPLHPSPAVSHMTTPFCFTPPLCRVWGAGTGEIPRGKGSCCSQAKLMKNPTVPCSTAPPSPDLNMKPHHMVLFTDSRITRTLLQSYPSMLGTENKQTCSKLLPALVLSPKPDQGYDWVCAKSQFWTRPWNNSGLPSSPESWRELCTNFPKLKNQKSNCLTMDWL